MPTAYSCSGSLRPRPCMSLSTSSSNAIRSRPTFRDELKVLLVVAACVLLVECAMRLWGPSLSGELRDFAALDRRAKNLAAHDGPRVLILGNSLTAGGLEHPELEEALSRIVPGELAIEQVTLNASQYREWHYLFQHFFVENGACPDYLVLNFNAHRNLDDENRLLTVPRLASYTRWQDTPALFRDDILSFEDRFEFLQSRLFASFASRSRVRKAVHLAMIPGYSDGAERVSAALNHRPGGDESAPLTSPR